MKKSLTLIVAILVLIGSGIVLYTMQPAPALATAGGEMPHIVKAQTAGAVAVSASASTLVMATSSSRLYSSVCNDGSTPVYLNFGNAAVEDAGIRLQSGACYEIAGGNLFTTAVNAIASTTGAVVTFIQVNGSQGTFGN